MQRIQTVLYNAQQGRAEFSRCWEWAKSMMTAGHKLDLSVKKQTRTTAQNSKMWATLSDISKQVVWYGKKLSPEDWKHVLTASLRQQETVPGIDGGFVVLGQSTKAMTIGEMIEVIELATAFGVQQGVLFEQD